MLAFIIIIVLAIIGTAALAVWVMDERAKIQSARRCVEICEDFDKSCVAHLAEVERNERLIHGHQPKPTAPSGMEQLEQIERDLDKLRKDTGPPFVEVDGIKYYKDTIRCYECGKKFRVEDTRPDLSRGVRLCVTCCDDLRERGQMAESDALFDPRLATATDRETVEKIQAFVDDSISNPRKIEIVESGWRPLPMEELRKKVK